MYNEISVQSQGQVKKKAKSTYKEDKSNFEMIIKII